MQIQSLKILHGANYYSASPVVVMQLDLKSYDKVFTHEIEGFYEKLLGILPSLKDNKENAENFPQSLKQGVLLGAVAEYIAIELQLLAGMDVGFVKTRSTSQKGGNHAVFSFLDEQAGRFAAQASVDLINQILQDQDFDIPYCVSRLRHLREATMPGPGTQSIIREATQRNIPVLRFDHQNLIQLGTGKYQKRMLGTISSETSFVSVENVKDSFFTTQMLSKTGIPVPHTLLTNNLEEALEFRKKTNKPVVVKTPNNEKNRTVFPALNSAAQIETAFTLCKNYHKNVLIQQHLPGETFRLLVINTRFVAATYLMAPEIIGNGKDTIAMLIEKLNLDQNRKPEDKGSLSIIQPDERLMENLTFHDYTLETVLAKDVRLVLNHHSSSSSGALTKDVTQIVHPLNRLLAERVASLCGINVAGVNVICPDIAKPIAQSQGAVLNVISAPDFRMHIQPWEGNSRNVTKPFLEMIFPENSHCRIPVFSITGSAGKSVCAYLINYMLEKEGLKTGLATTDGVFINGHKIINNNMCSNEAAQIILQDPSVDSAVLETSLESILENGLGYPYADYGIVLNFHDDYPEYSDDAKSENLFNAKAVVAEELYSEGYAILNAEDPHTLQLHQQVTSKLALFSHNPSNKVFKKHCMNGGLGICAENHMLFLWNTSGKTCVANLEELPLWANGKNKIFLDALMAAVLAISAFDINPERISEMLKAFKPKPHNLYGRLSEIFIQQKKIIFDIPGGEKALLNIKEIIENSGNVPEFFIDVNNLDPKTFIRSFFEVFNNNNLKLHVFCTPLENYTPPQKSPKNPNEIVPYKEKSLLQYSPKYEVKEKEQLQTALEEIHKTMKNKTNIIVWENMEEFMNALQKEDEGEKITLVFTHNFSELYELINQKVLIS